MNTENKKYYNCPECGAKTEMKYYGGTCPECGYTAGAVPPPPPTELSIAYKQLGLLVLDSSGSMKCDNLEKIPKAAAVSKSVSEFFEKMQQSTIDNHFCFAIVKHTSCSTSPKPPTLISTPSIIQSQSTAKERSFPRA